LIAAADDKGAVLDEGLTREALRAAPKPAKGPRDAPRREAPDALPNDLPAERWGIIMQDQATAIRRDDVARGAHPRRERILEPRLDVVEEILNLDFAPYWRPAWLINVLRFCKLP
jgi:hypothetical protein